MISKLMLIIVLLSIVVIANILMYKISTKKEYISYFVYSVMNFISYVIIISLCF